MPQTGLQCIIPLCLCVGACSLSPLCRLQVFKREIRESGWVRPADVSSGEPVCFRLVPQKSRSTPSARLRPRFAALAVVSPCSCSPFTFLSSLRMCPLFMPHSRFLLSVNSVPWFSLISEVSVSSGCFSLIVRATFCFFSLQVIRTCCASYLNKYGWKQVQVHQNSFWTVRSGGR